MSTRSARSWSARQPGGQRDVRSGQRARYGAGRLRLRREPFKRGLVDAADATDDVELDARDREARIELLEMHARAGLQILGRVARLAQLVRERHREAARVGSADQLFRVRARLP